MTKENEMQELIEIYQRAKERGFCPSKIMEFFISWYQPKEVQPLVEEIQHTYTMCFLAVKENTFENEDLKNHLAFLQLFKQIMNDAVVTNVN
jgi:hypothetical protein